MDNSFIKLHRRILKWEWYTDPNMFHFFLHLLLKASFKDGRYRGVDVKKGQLVTGRIELATDTGLSEMQIRTCIKKLKSTNEITTFATNKYTIITVCKYDSYQDNKVDSNQQNNQLRNQRSTNEQPSSNQRSTTIEEGIIREEGKEIKEKKEDSDKSPTPISFKNFSEKQFYDEVATFKEKYDKTILREFYDYWREKSPGGKMNFQLQKTWETNLRLQTWQRRQNSFNSTSKNFKNEINHEAAAAGQQIRDEKARAILNC